ncbi:hypothetical protein TI04_04810 [Achromatium sp. WMS2]|nr:hypothetical protein TI04_04810 [Achromatium sp. WMS2]
MQLIRSWLYTVFLGVSTVVYASAILLMSLWYGLDSRSRWANKWGAANMWALRVICKLDYEIIGAENLPTTNCIVMVNHQSTWETLALRAILPANQAWVVKQELLAIPFFGWTLRVLESIAIDRAAGIKALKHVLKHGTDALNQGRWVIIFPEGTRVPLGEQKKYNIGGAMLAEKSGYPILPVAHNAGMFWNPKSTVKNRGKIKVVIGPLIQTRGKTTGQINSAVKDWLDPQVKSLIL